MTCREEKLLNKLKWQYPQVKTGLEFSTPFELLIATILSAQCTDVRVNKITEELFSVANTPEKILALGKEQLIEYIRGAGLYKNKSKNIIESCQILLEKHDGQVPRSRDELEQLPGVGRKTASVVLANAFEVPAFPVDTHVFRVSKRLGLSNGQTPEAVEQDLQGFFAKGEWNVAHLLLIEHGRAVCKSRSPNCNQCILTDNCQYYDQHYVQH